MNIFTDLLTFGRDLKHTDKPSTLDQLFRFSQHEDRDAAPHVEWQVSAGSLEEKKRLYRIFYKEVGGSVPILDMEVTMRIKKPEDLKIFTEVMLAAVDNPAFVAGFRNTCRQLLILDPWLGYMWAQRV